MTDAALLAPHQRVRLSPLRRRGGEQMARSVNEIPHASITVETDFGAIMSTIEQLGVDWRATHQRSLTPLPFVLAALVATLGRFPEANASLDGRDLIVFDAVNLGIAVDVPGSGLVVPVIRDAHEMSVADLAGAVADLAERARSKSLHPDDVTGATYTVTNIGSMGAFNSSPIINHPQVAILAVNSIVRRPVVVDGEVTVRPIGLLTQAFDHRAFDGAYCAGLLRDLSQNIAETDWERSFSIQPAPRNEHPQEGA